MAANLHVLRTTAVTDRESVVRTLEKMLQHARNGTWSDGDAAAMLGAVSYLQSRLLDALK